MPLYQRSQRKKLDQLVGEFAQSQIDRRAFLQRAVAVGLSASAAAALLDACGGTTSSTSAPISLKFYGDVTTDSSSPAMYQALQQHFKGKYNIQYIPVDFNAIDTVIKTGIASGSPDDIYFYWPQQVKSYVTAGEVLDLTPYLEANHNAWMNTFVPSNLELGKYNGKYYDVPIIQQSTAIYVNDTLAQQLGVTIPDHMSWSQFVALNQQIKTTASGKGIFPFGIEQDWQSWIVRNGILSLGNDAGKLDALTNAQVPATDPIFVEAVKNAGALFTNNYIYPGQGALTASADEVKAAFAQGKIVMYAGVFSVAKDIEKVAQQSHFTLRVVDWPAMGSKSILVGGCNGFFIPANAPHPQQAVEVLQYYLGQQVQSINASYGLPTSNALVKVTDPVLEQVLKNAGTIHPGEFYSFSPQITQYFEQDLVPKYVLGENLTTDLTALEKLRQQALASQS